MTKKLFALLFWLVILSIASLTFAETGCVNWNLSSLTNICKCNPWYTKVDWVCTKCDGKDICCWVKLNTDVPFVWKCITLSSEDPTATGGVVTEQNAFPVLVAWLTKLLMTIILIVCFLVLVVAWVIRTTWNAKKWKELITWVAIALALLWASGVILRIVNPNFFG